MPGPGRDSWDRPGIKVFLALSTQKKNNNLLFVKKKKQKTLIPL
jgi:hypothetical protein